jgi:predicted XRE-type DNA-binding protein
MKDEPTLEDLRIAQEDLRHADAQHEIARKVLKGIRDQRLAVLRGRGLSKHELADALGVSRPHVGVLLRKMGIE